MQDVIRKVACSVCNSRPSLLYLLFMHTRRCHFSSCFVRCMRLWPHVMYCIYSHRAHSHCIIIHLWSDAEVVGCRYVYWWLWLKCQGSARQVGCMSADDYCSSACHLRIGIIFVCVMIIGPHIVRVRTAGDYWDSSVCSLGLDQCMNYNIFSERSLCDCNWSQYLFHLPLIQNTV